MLHATYNPMKMIGAYFTVLAAADAASHDQCTDPSNCQERTVLMQKTKLISLTISSEADAQVDAQVEHALLGNYSNHSHHDKTHDLDAAEACALYFWDADQAACTSAMQGCYDGLGSDTNCNVEGAAGLHACVNSDIFMTCIVREVQVTGCSAIPDESLWGECLACGYHNWETCVADGRHGHDCQYAPGMIDKVRACMGKGEHNFNWGGYSDHSHHDKTHDLDAAEACALYFWDDDQAECTSAMAGCYNDLAAANETCTAEGASGLHACVDNNVFMTCVVREVEVTGCMAIPDDKYWGACLACGYHNWETCVADNRHGHDCQHAPEMIDKVRACMGAGEHGLKLIQN